MSHSIIHVLDQDQAKAYYADKLGFDVKVDQSLPNGFRWLTVSPKGQPELEIALMKVGSGGDFIKIKGGEAESTNSKEKDIDTIASLLARGKFSGGAFQTADCRKTYES